MRTFRRKSARLSLEDSPHFTGKELTKLHLEYKRISKNKGFLDQNGFRQCLGVLGLVEDSLLCQRLFDVFNTSKTRKITFVEYVKGLGVLMKGSVDEKLDFAFSLADMDSSGELSVEELQLTIESMMRIYAGVMGKGPVQTTSTNNSKIKRIFKRLDVDKDGKISKEEFKVGLTQHPELIKLLKGSQQVKSDVQIKLAKAENLNKCYRRLCCGLELGINQSIYLAEQLGEKDSDLLKKPSLNGNLVDSNNSVSSNATITSESKEASEESQATHSALAQLLSSLIEVQETLRSMSQSNFPMGLDPKLKHLVHQASTRALQSKSPTKTSGSNVDLNRVSSDFEADLVYTSDENELSNYYTSDQEDDIMQLTKPQAGDVAIGTETTQQETATANGNAQDLEAEDVKKRKKSAARKERKLEKFLMSSARPGNTVFFGHKNWDLVVNVMKGIQMAVNRVDAETNRPISVFDFSVKEKYTLISENSPVTAKWTKKRQDIDTKSCRFLDYSPYVFKKLRESFGILSSEYIDSIGPANMISNLMLGSLSSLSEHGSEGKSGSFFYITPDGKYLIKTIHREEHKLFRQVLPQYYHHMVASKTQGTAKPKSLLTWILGCHIIRFGRHSKFKAGKIYLVVMNNVLGSDVPLDYRFDLKGSRTGRKHTAAVRKEHKATLKDLDFVDMGFKFKVGPVKKLQLMASLRRDCEFLEKMGLIDYSLLLGIHQVTNPGSLPKFDERHLMIEKSTDGKEIYFFGVLDFLTPYSGRKMAEQVFKTMQYWDPEGISVQPPHKYARRFLAFMDRIIQ